jgi:hypothetical protein
VVANSPVAARRSRLGRRSPLTPERRRRNRSALRAAYTSSSQIEGRESVRRGGGADATAIGASFRRAAAQIPCFATPPLPTSSARLEPLVVRTDEQWNLHQHPQEQMNLRLPPLGPLCRSASAPRGSAPHGHGLMSRPGCGRKSEVRGFLQRGVPLTASATVSRRFFIAVSQRSAISVRKIDVPKREISSPVISNMDQLGGTLGSVIKDESRGYAQRYRQPRYGGRPFPCAIIVSIAASHSRGLGSGNIPSGSL